ncbi:hypothetical protein R84B8_00586 [Treponema sp. R8-4-B8]
MSYQQKLNRLGLEVPFILLPKTARTSPSELVKWPVIACDQFTQDHDYWEKAKAFTAGSPSALNLIFPEIYLCDDDVDKRIADIHSTMRRYLQENVFAQARQGFIYIERDTPYQKKRRGLIVAVDLEQYDWRPESRPLIRCTEGAVPERLPPRMDIRRGAPLELPHVILLIDDEADALLPAIGEKVKNTAPCYSTQLMMDSGSVTGWFLDIKSGEGTKAVSIITEKIDALYNRSTGRYGGEGKPFLFAVGDGNHSIAAAKGIWEEYKASVQPKAVMQPMAGDSLPVHPCRYALVEIENIYDPAIQFEPIHRVVFDVGYDEIVKILSALPDFSCRPVNSARELSELCAKQPQVPFANRFGVISQNRYALIETSASGIATACLQPLLDKYAGDNPQLIDYIHDEEEVFRVSGDGGQSGANRKRAGILLPPFQKSVLFETVARLGPLPRKSFSMGHSAEKRFYLECREIR